MEKVSAMRAIAAIATILLTLAGARAEANPAASAQTACAAAVSREERSHGIPDHLLTAISVVESGRWDEDSRATIAWPWTINSAGTGTFFPTKAEAVAEVGRLQRQGVRSIDVGCMQVNLMYHPEAFASIEDAFDPDRNAGYAADFLTRLNDESGSWIQAASNYHSRDPDLGDYYRTKVAKAWDARRGAAPDTMAASYQSPAMAQILPISKDLDDLRKTAAAQRAQLLARNQAEAEEARKVANAWREARLKEYLERKAQRTARLNQTAQRPDTSSGKGMEGLAPPPSAATRPPA